MPKDKIYTPQQQEAIDTRKGNVLVSASAGSGKTAVLTERAFQIIKEGTPLNKLLILTFTNLAAAEMRQRIRGKLVDDGEIELASSLDAVNIQTYDAFALSLVQKYYQRIGIASDVRVVDASLIELEQRKTLEAILDKYYKEENPEVLSLIKEYCLKDTNDIKDVVYNLAKLASLTLDPKEYLNNFVDTYYSESVIRKNAQNFLNTCKNRLEFVKGKLDEFENRVYADKTYPVLQTLIDQPTIESFYNKMHEEGFGLPKPGKGDLVLEASDKVIKDFIKSEYDAIKGDFVYASENEIVTHILETVPFVNTIVKLTLEMMNQIEAFKRKHATYTFADIFKYALEIVKLDDIKEKLKNKFEYIMIDEYQDTSDLQEGFISLFSNDNVFCVGDIKQSIYRFRNANCALFLNKMNEYADGIKGKNIILPDNYRSRATVIESINGIFKPIMTKAFCGLDYDKDHKMVSSNDCYKSAPTIYSTDRLVYNLEDEMFKDKYMSHGEVEARIIANDILEKMSNPSLYQVYDSKLKQYRDIEYKDFAIISYAKTDFDTYQKVFNLYQIPLFANYDLSIKDNDLTYCFKNIYKLISLYRQNDFSSSFNHAFVSILRSFLIDEDDQIVHSIITNNSYSEHPLFSVVESLSDETLNCSLEHTTLKIIEMFDIYNKLPSIHNISNNVDLITYFYEKSKEMDLLDYSLDDFSRYFDELDEYDISPEFKVTQKGMNSVTILSIHASKGLQFKFCYFPALYKTINKGNKARFKVDSKYGIDLMNMNYKDTFTLYKKLIANKEAKETLLEQIRVFYVALTRTEEKMIFVTQLKKKEKSFADPSQIKTYQDMIDYCCIRYCDFNGSIEDPKGNTNKPAMDATLKLDVVDYKGMSKESYIPHIASKGDANDVDTKLLELGNKYHYYLELMDFKTKDTSFIKDEKDKEVISKFLSNDIFKNTELAKVMHEYPFYDEVNDINGVIDLLLVYPDHIDIVDFKLSHVDDEAYEKQVKVYKEYISQISSLPISLYVTGIMSGDIKKVE